MFKSTTVSVTSTTVPKKLFSLQGTTNSPIPVDVYNAGTHTVLVGSSTKTHCLRPLVKGASMQFGVIGGSSLYGKLTATGPVNVVVTVGP